jgi:hypothetical protein
MKALIIALLLLLTGCAAPPPELRDCYCKSDSTSFNLVINSTARDVSYTALLAFLDTFKPEVLPSKTCGHYAEELYNYSESLGIRCAVVIANTHAFNGFNTDGKMTYVDAGEGVISIATKDGTGLKFVKDYGGQVQTQTVGPESGFEVFWC